MATHGERWRFWLETQLEDKSWRPADLVRASGVKGNGRPVIDATRVSAWLKGERPSFELASVAGEALGVGAAAAIAAAGYTTGPRTAETPALSVVPTIVVGPQSEEDEEDNEVLAAVRRDPYLDEDAREHYLNQYHLLREMSAARKAARDDRMAYVARTRGGKPKAPVGEAKQSQLEEIVRQTMADPEGEGEVPTE